ncbi:MAG: type IX secretion system sortase PorU [Candidatus Krumholzibacteriia bacterium]
MCIFTHFAAGALAGAATGNPWAALAAGLASHALLDLFPHYDFEDWRQEVAIGLVPLLLLLLSPWASAAAVIGGLAGCLPDLENLLQKLGRLERRHMIFPSHTGLLPHGARRGPRNLWVQAALAAGCLAALALVTPGAARAAVADPVFAADGSPLPVDADTVDPAAGAPLAIIGPQQARLLVAGDAATQLEVRFPLEREPADWSAVSPAAVMWREPGMTVRDGESGTRALPSAHAWILAVPTLDTPVLTAVDVVWRREPKEPLPAERLVTVEGPRLFRGVPLAIVRVIGEAPGGGIPERITIGLAHPPSGEPGAALAAAGRARATATRQTALPFGADGVLNADLFARLSAGDLQRAQAAPARAAALHPFGLTTHWARFDVVQTAVHRVTGYDLSLLGIVPAQIDPATLRLFRGGGLPEAADPVLPGSWQDGWTGLTEVAIAVRDDDGIWDSGDAVTFYGVGGDAWRDRYSAAAGRLDHFEHPYTGYGTYWLTWEAPGTPSPLPGTPLRIGAPTPAPALGGPLVTSWHARLHREESYEDASGRLADNWAWDTRIRNQRDLTFDVGPVVSDQPTRFVVDVRSYYLYSTLDYVENHATSWLNDDTGNPVTITWTVASEEDSLRVRLVGQSPALHSGVNTLHLRNEHGTSGGLDLVLDSFDVLYWQPLVKSATGGFAFTHWGDQVTTPGEMADLRVTLPDQAPVTLWDVTNPDAPYVLAGDIVGGSAPAVTVGLTRSPGEDRHFVLFDDSDPVTPPMRNRRFPVDLRATTGPCDYVVIYDPLFAAAAQELVDLRNDRLPGVAAPVARAVSEEAIYDNFSGGRKDPWALRNFLKWLYLRDADPLNPTTGRRLKYVCLVGDASHDYRNYLQHDPASQNFDFVPTIVRTVFPRRAVSADWENPYASDDALVSFDAPARWQTLDIPDLASGRLTVSTAAEALAAVRRIRAAQLEPEPGSWRNRVVFAADDLSHKGENLETFHTVQAEELTGTYLPLSLDLVKLYMVEYPNPPGNPAKPAARQEARRLLSEGLTIFHFIGHGSENVLADEQLLLTEDIASLTNGARRGLFVAFSCDVGVYDSPLTQSMAEIFVSQAAGGAITAIAAAQASFINSNDELSADFYHYLYPDRLVNAALTPGEALLLAKRASFYLVNSQKYLLFGDPALRLPQPSAGLSFLPGSVDTLRAGLTAAALAGLASAGLDPGAGYDLRVEESRYDRVITNPYLRYSLPGAAAFRGGGTAATDPLRVPFRTPLQLHYGAHGKVRLIVDGPDGALATAAEVPVVAAVSEQMDDLTGPTIALAFPDGRYRVPPGTTLGAALADTSGVNVLGTTPNSSILFELDASGVFTDVTEAFTFDSGSYTQGRLDLALPLDLAAGPHRLALFASDVLGNVGSDTLAFQVVPAGTAGLAGVTLFPNPTPGDCRLVFELSEPMTVEWDIYTVGGRRIWRQREEFATAGPKILRWDGRDGEGDGIANGVYLYVLRGSRADDPAHEVREKGRIVIMK